MWAASTSTGASAPPGQLCYGGAHCIKVGVEANVEAESLDSGYSVVALGVVWMGGLFHGVQQVAVGRQMPEVTTVLWSGDLGVEGGLLN